MEVMAKLAAEEKAREKERAEKAARRAVREVRQRAESARLNAGFQKLDAVAAKFEAAATSAKAPERKEQSGSTPPYPYHPVTLPQPQQWGAGFGGMSTVSAIPVPAAMPAAQRGAEQSAPFHRPAAISGNGTPERKRAFSTLADPAPVTNVIVSEQSVPGSETSTVTRLTKMDPSLQTANIYIQALTKSALPGLNSKEISVICNTLADYFIGRKIHPDDKAAIKEFLTTSKRILEREGVKTGALDILGIAVTLGDGYKNYFDPSTPQGEINRDKVRAMAIASVESFVANTKDVAKEPMRIASAWSPEIVKEIMIYCELRNRQALPSEKIDYRDNSGYEIPSPFFIISRKPNGEEVWTPSKAVENMIDDLRKIHGNDKHPLNHLVKNILGNDKHPLHRLMKNIPGSGMHGMGYMPTASAMSVAAPPGAGQAVAFVAPVYCDAKQESVSLHRRATVSISRNATTGIMRALSISGPVPVARVVPVQSPPAVVSVSKPFVTDADGKPRDPSTSMWTTPGRFGMPSQASSGGSFRY